MNIFGRKGAAAAAVIILLAAWSRRGGGGGGGGVSAQQLVFSREPAARVPCPARRGCSLPCAARSLAPSRDSPAITWLDAAERPLTILPKLREVSGNGSLVLFPFSADDFRADVHAAAYRCRAATAAGSSTAAVLSREARVEPVMESAWEARGEVTRGADGTPALLRCALPAAPHVHVTRWFRGDEPLGDADGQVSVGGGRGEYLVVAAGGAGAGGARYSCEAQHALTGDVRRSKPIDIHKTPPVLSLVPRILATPSEETVAEGDDIRLVCFAVGDPPITYSWYRVWGGREESVSSGVRVSVRGAVLVVRRARGPGGGAERGGEGDAGTWSCRARNAHGDARRDITLHVLSPLTVTITPTVQPQTYRRDQLGGGGGGGGGDQLLPLIATATATALARRGLHTSIQAPRQQLIATATATATATAAVADSGSVVYFECSASARDARLRWARGGGAGGALDQGGGALALGGRLRVGPVTRAHGGLYQCFAERDNDNAQAVAELKLGDVAPELQYTFIEQALHPGGGVALQCAAAGAPPPRISWLLDHQPLDDRPSPQRSISQTVLSSGEVVGFLNISSARPEHGGRYTCRAHNRRGTVEHTARLNVYGPPSVRDVGTVQLVAGENATIYCPYSGYPISSVSWFREGVALASGAGGVAGAEGALRLAGAVREDAGRYSCRVTGAQGLTAARDVHVIVRIPPKIAEFFFPKDLTEGGRVQVLCGITSGDKPIFFSWLKDGDRLPAVLQIDERTIEDFSYLRILHLTSQHSGQYTCIASNSAAHVNHTATLRVQMPAAWSEEPRGAAVRAGDALLVPCAARGEPPPRISWLKGDGDSVEDFRGVPLSPPLEVMENGTLWAAHASPSLGGRYMCRADNGVGKPVAKIVPVTVHEPPQLEWSGGEGEGSGGRVSVRRGEGVTLSCSARGGAPIAISWTHDNQPIDFSSYRLTVEEAAWGGGVTSRAALAAAARQDAGAYRCRATNPHGAADLTLYLTVLEEPAAVAGVQWVREEKALRWRPPAPAPAAPPAAYTLQLARLPPLPAAAAAPTTVDWAHADTRDIPAMTLTYISGGDMAGATGSESVEGGVLQHVPAGLAPGARYAARVAAHNHVGRSNYSDTVYIHTDEEPPSEPPQDFQVNSDIPGEFQLKWKPPPPESWNGQLLGYVYCWRTEGSPSGGHCVNARGGDVREGTVPLSAPKSARWGGNMRWDIDVRAFNAEGVGPPALAPARHSAHIVPRYSPAKVRCEGISTDTLRVWWHADVYLTNTPIIGFDIIYEVVEERGGAAEVMQVAVPEGDWSQGEALVRGARAGSNYSVAVRARAAPGAGPLSERAACRTPPAVPSPPADVKIVVILDGSLVVVWLPPLRKNGIILYYNVYSRPHSGGHVVMKVPAVSDGEQTAVLATGAGTAVREAWVTAVTRVGEGDMSKVVSATNVNDHSHMASFGGHKTVAQGAAVRLPCGAGGRGTWTAEGRNLRGDTRYTIDGDFLLIRSVAAGPWQNYTCVSRGPGGGEERVRWSVRGERPPAPPRLLPATPPRPSRLGLSWPPPDPTAAYVHSYLIEWSPAIGQAYWASRDENVWGSAYLYGGLHVEGSVHVVGSAHVLEGLSCGTALAVRAAALTWAGASPYSELLVSTAGGPPRAPMEKDLITTKGTCVRINLLTWDSNGCPIASFVVEYRAFDSSSWEHMPTNHVDGFVPFTLCDLPPATWYHLRVQATNEAGRTTNTYYFATLTENGEEPERPAMFPAAESAGAGGALAGAGGALAAAAAAAALLLAAALYCARGPSRECCSSKGYKSGNMDDGSDEKMDCKESIRLSGQPVYTSSPVKNCSMKDQEGCDVYEISPYATFSMSARPAAPAAPAARTPRAAPDRYKSISRAMSSARSDSESSESLCSECQPYAHHDKGGGGGLTSHPASVRSGASGLVLSAAATGAGCADSSAESSAECRRGERTRRRARRHPGHVTASPAPSAGRLYSRQDQERRDFTIHV